MRRCGRYEQRCISLIRRGPGHPNPRPPNSLPSSPHAACAAHRPIRRPGRALADPPGRPQCRPAPISLARSLSVLYGWCHG
jgi:hypothetical protein